MAPIRVFTYFAIKALCPIPIPLAPLSRRLRQDTGEKRVSLVRHNGKLKVRGHLTNGQSVFRDLEAADELAALDKARDLVMRLLEGKDPRALAPLTGHLKLYVRDAMEKLEQKRVRGRPLRPQTLAMYHRRMVWLADWLTSRGRPVTASNIVMAIADSTYYRSRKETITVARYLAQAAGINLEIPAHLKPVRALPPARTVLAEEDILRALKHAETRMDEGYFYTIAFCAVTGARGSMALSARLPEDPKEPKPGYTISCYDPKRSRPARVTLVMDVWDELGIWAHADGVPPKLWMPHDRPPTDAQVTKANAYINCAGKERARKLEPWAAEILTYRQVRHFVGSKMLDMGIDPLQVADLLSTSTNMLEKVHSDHFRHRGAEAVGAAFYGK